MYYLNGNTSPIKSNVAPPTPILVKNCMTNTKIIAKYPKFPTNFWIYLASLAFSKDDHPNGKKVKP